MTTQLDRIEAKLDRLQGALDSVGPLVQAIPDALATVGNTVDDLAARDGHARMDQRLRRAVAVLVRLGDPEVLTALELVAEAAAELPHAAAAPPEDHGLLGLVRVLGEDEVQRALSCLIHFTRRFGRLLDEHDRA